VGSWGDDRVGADDVAEWKVLPEHRCVSAKRLRTVSAHHVDSSGVPTPASKSVVPA
jgi:hypothetical protein